MGSESTLFVNVVGVNVLLCIFSALERKISVRANRDELIQKGILLPDSPSFPQPPPTSKFILITFTWSPNTANILYANSWRVLKEHLDSAVERTLSLVCIIYRIKFSKKLYFVRGLERSELGGSHGPDFYDRSILRPKHRAYYRSSRPVIKIGPKGALGSNEIRPIHSAPSLGPSI